MNEKMKKILFGLLGVAVLVFCVCSFLTEDLEHIEDTNGPDDYSLTTITDANIVNQDVGALNVKRATGLFNDGITFSSNKFTGVYRVLVTNYILPSDFLMDVSGFYVNGGNFRMVLVNQGQIIAEVEPGMFPQCYVEDITGTTELIIAGESADFEFTLSRLFCEQYGISVN